jgi:dTDP-4-dehydrorhamnose 3,5-epimerase
MELTPLGIEGAWLAESPLWNDDRGHFREWFKYEEILSKTGIDFSVQQANVSHSRRGVIRGIHYSLAPDGQAKWVTCVAGNILDVVVDVRPESPTFKRWTSVELSGDSDKAVLIGKGLGHGFISLESNSIVSYLLSSKYSPQNEFSINPLDTEIGIHWGLPHSEIVVSARDGEAPTINKANFKK